MEFTKYTTSKEEKEVLKKVSEIMLLMSKDNIYKFDKVICNKNYNEIENVSQFNGITCSNYRAVQINGEKIYLRVSSIDIDDPKATAYDLVTFIQKNCDSETKKLIKGPINNNNIIYFKGAYTSYPDEWMNKNKSVDIIRPESFEIYKNATKSILFHILPYLKKIGIEYLLVDPEPGYHPKQISKTEEKKREGLIELYESMGLKKIKCHYRVCGLIGKQFGYTCEQIRESSGNLAELSYDTTVMIGNVSEMVKKLNPIESTITDFAPFLPTFFAKTVEKVALAASSMVDRNAEELKLFKESNVPFKSFTSDKDPTKYIENSLRSLLTEKEMKDIMDNGTDLIYQQKYLKYKKKYLELKKLM